MRAIIALKTIVPMRASSARGHGPDGNLADFAPRSDLWRTIGRLKPMKTMSAIRLARLRRAMKMVKTNELLPAAPAKEN